MKGTTTGKADVYLDDVLVTTIDLSNSVPIYEQHVWSTEIIEPGLPPGQDFPQCIEPRRQVHHP